MPIKIHSLKLERFRAFRELNIEDLGRVNLITGRNNTGKSSVLEGVHILARNGARDVIDSILKYREECIDGSREEDHSLASGTLPRMSGLFHGFLRLSENPEPIVISANGGTPATTVAIRAGRFSEKRESGGNYRLFEADPRDEPDGALCLVIQTKSETRFHRIERFRQDLRYPVSAGPSLPSDENRTSCIFVSPYGGERTATLGGLWDGIALSDSERDVVEALRIIDPRISAVSMIGDTRRARTAIVRADCIPRPVPLRSFGDGLNRLFGIILALVNARDGFLLVDEFENGLHHTVQLDAWRIIFRLARTLDVQVFATSHSWDTITAFQQTAAETPETGFLIRLARKGADIIPTVFAEDELTIATRDRIEVR